MGAAIVLLEVNCEELFKLKFFNRKILILFELWMCVGFDRQWLCLCWSISQRGRDIWQTVAVSFLVYQSERMRHLTDSGCVFFGLSVREDVTFDRQWLCLFWSVSQRGRNIWQTVAVSFLVHQSERTRHLTDSGCVFFGLSIREDTTFDRQWLCLFWSISQRGRDIWQTMAVSFLVCQSERTRHSPLSIEILIISSQN
jgi:hypothetical protein